MLSLGEMQSLDDSYLLGPWSFKNLVFFGGPIINPGKVAIYNLNLLKLHINIFNKHFSSYQVSVQEGEDKDECLYAFNNIETNTQFEWIRKSNI